MTVKDLDTRMSNALNDFSVTIQSQFSETSDKPVTQRELAEVCKQCFYAMQEIRESIIEYLSQR